MPLRVTTLFRQFSYYRSFPFLVFLLTVLCSSNSQAQQTYTSGVAEGWLYSIWIYPNPSNALAQVCGDAGGSPARTESVTDKPWRLAAFCNFQGPDGTYDQQVGNIDWAQSCGVGYTAIWGAGGPRGTQIVRCERVAETRLGQPEVCLETGCTNPIMLSSRRKIQSEMDYTGTGSYPLTFVRTYSSGRTGLSRLPLENEFVPYWHHNYSMRLSGSLDGSTPAKPSRYTLVDGGVVPEPSGGGGVLNGIIAERADGSSIYFIGFLADANQKVKIERTVLADGADGLVLTTADNNQEFYRLDGRLFATCSQAGETHTLIYSPDNQLMGVTDDYGKSLTFSYDDNERLISVTDPGGKKIQYTYTEFGDFHTVTFPNTGGGAKSREYLYESEPRLLTGIIDERGKRYTSWSYDTSASRAGLGKESSGPNGINRVQVTQPNDYQVETTDSLGLTTVYNFSAIGGARLLTSKQRQATLTTPSATQTRGYNNRGFLTSITDWNGNRTTYARNRRGLATRTTLAVGTEQERTILREWHPDFLLPLLETFPNYQISYERDSRGNVLTRTVTDTATSDTRQWRYTYDAQGKVRTMTGPRTDVSDRTVFTYYNCSTGGRCGQLKTRKNALGHVTRFTRYNAHGQLTRMIDPNGTVISFTYDARQRLKTQSVGGQVTRLAYDHTGNITRITLPDGTYTQYTWDAANRLTRVRDKAQNTVIWTLDKAGNRKKEIMKEAGSGNLYEQQRAYDALRRMITRTYAHGGADGYTFDDNGNAVSMSDAADRTESRTYDALDRLVQLKDALDGKTVFTHDQQDNITLVTDAKGRKTRYTYNGFGDRVTQVSPDTGTTSYTYDEAGNVLTQTDALGITETYTYDALNRLTSIIYPNGTETITYTYDQGANGIGQLTQVQDHSGTTSFSYDPRGNVIERISVIDGQSYTASFEYNGADRLLSMTYPSGRRVSYTYDNSGRVSSVSSAHANGTTQSIASGIDRLPFGPIEAMTLGNGIERVRSYDKDYRIENLSDATVLSRNYAWSAVNTITAMTDSLAPAASQLFDYDALDRLTFATGGYGERSYTYDAVGNRLTEERSAGVDNGTDTYRYFGKNHRLRNLVGERRYTYDAAGNTKRDSTRNFTYNQQGRMSRVVSDGLSTTYRYNALGQRVLKQNSQGTTHYVFDLDGRLMAEAQGGEIVAEYGYLDGEPLALWRDGDVPLPVTLLNNGGFESGKADWLSCADVGSTRIVTNRSEGAKAVRLKNADCLYQEFAVTPNKHYTLQCDAKGAQTKYTSIRLTIMNAEFTQLRSTEKAITSNAYETYSGTVRAPGAGAIGAVTLYSEGTGFFDACSITEGS